MRKFLYIILSFSLIFSPIFAYAGLPSPVNDYAVTIKNVQANSASVSADFAFRKTAANAAEYATKANVSKMAIAGQFLKRFTLFGAATVGFEMFADYLEQADWTIDLQKKEIYHRI